MALSKKAARELLVVIEAYAEAKAEKHWHDDQGYGNSVAVAQAEYEVQRANLLAALGLPGEEKA